MSTRVPHGRSAGQSYVQQPAPVPDLPTGSIFEHVLDGNPHPANARLPTSRARLDGDQLRVIHVEIVPR
jgi:hypothetical protein